MTFMPKASRHFLATSVPMRPSPTSPSVLPSRSTVVFEFLTFHSQARTDLSMKGSCLAMPSIRATVCSATETVFAPGVLQTMMPCSVAATRSTLSTPTPVREMIRHFPAASMSSREIWMFVRRITPSTSAIIFFAVSSVESGRTLNSTFPSRRFIASG